MKSKIDWDSIAHRFGVDSDCAIGRDLGIDHQPVRMERRRRGIAAARFPYKDRIDWSQQEHRLGIEDDAAIAADLGCPVDYVRQARDRRGIPPVLAPVESLPGEEWRGVLGYDGWYEVSNLGRVRSWRRAGPTTDRASVPHLLEPYPATSGYLLVSLCRGTGRPRKRPIHQLVLEAFIGKCPRGQQCAHLNGNREDPRLENLIWATQKENEAHKIAHGTLLFGEAAPWHKLSEDQVREIRRLGRTETQQRIADMFGIAQGTVGKILNFQRWRRLDEACA